MPAAKPFAAFQPQLDAFPFAPDPSTLNPWVSDQVLLGLSVWWVRMARPDTADFSTEVALTFKSLERQLRPHAA